MSCIKDCCVVAIEERECCGQRSKKRSVKDLCECTNESVLWLLAVSGFKG